jgi:hypothetical protein
MAAGEDQRQQVVADPVVELRVEVGRAHRHHDPEVARERLLLALKPRIAAEHVDRAVLGRGHEPGARVVRDARLGPRLERREERLLGQVLGEADVAHHARQPGDQPARLDPPDGVYRTVRVAPRHRS